MRYYLLEGEVKGNWKNTYEQKTQPNSAVPEIWRSRSFENDGARIKFVECDYYDKDPDSVREACGCMYASVYRLTVDVDEADPEKLYVYTVETDGNVKQGFDIDMEKTRAVYIFREPRSFGNALLLAVTKKAELMPPADCVGEENRIMTELVKNELLGGREDVVCFFMLKNRC